MYTLGAPMQMQSSYVSHHQHYGAVVTTPAGKGKGMGKGYFQQPSNPNANSPNEWAQLFNWTKNELTWNMAGNCNLTDEFFNWAVEAFGVKKTMFGDLKAREIDFSKCQMNDEKLEKLIAVLEQFEVYATKFKFFGNNICLCDPIVRYLESGFASELREVHLSHNQLDDSACYQIIDTSVSVFGARATALWLRIEHNPVTNAEAITENFGPLVCRCIRPSVAEQGAAVAIHQSFYQESQANRGSTQSQVVQTGGAAGATTAWSSVNKVVQQNRAAAAAPRSTRNMVLGAPATTPMPTQADRAAAAMSRQAAHMRPASKAAGVRPARQVTGRVNPAVSTGTAMVGDNMAQMLQQPYTMPRGGIPVNMQHQIDGTAMSHSMVQQPQHFQQPAMVFTRPMTMVQPPPGMPMPRPARIPPAGMPMPSINLYQQQPAAQTHNSSAAHREPSGVGGRSSALSRDPGARNTQLPTNNGVSPEHTGGQTKTMKPFTGKTAGGRPDTSGLKPIRLAAGTKRLLKSEPASPPDTKRAKVTLTERQDVEQNKVDSQHTPMFKIPVPPKKPVPPPSASSLRQKPNSPIRPTPKSTLRKKK